MGRYGGCGLSGRLSLHTDKDGAVIYCFLVLPGSDKRRTGQRVWPTSACDQSHVAAAAAMVKPHLSAARVLRGVVMLVLSYGHKSPKVAPLLVG